MTLLHCILVAATGLGEPPSPPSPAAQDAALVVQLHEDLRQGSITDEQYTRQLNAIAANIDFSILTTGEIDQFSQGWFFDVTQTQQLATARLDRLMHRRDVDGLLAACTRVRVMSRAQWRAPDAITFVRTPLIHPGWLPAADPESVGLKALVGHLQYRIDPPFPQHLLPELQHVAAILVQDSRPPAPLACEKLVRCLSTVPGLVQRAPELAGLCEQARLKALAAARADEAYAGDAHARASAIAFLESQIAQLRFFDHVAPAIEPLWTSDPNVGSLAAVRGKVVVLEFWSVTCGPCVGNIAKMERLRQEATGKPVAFISVTSAVQEDRSEPKNPTDHQVQTAAHVLKEFMAAKQMTGTVWVTPAGAFEPSYGVQGIPHVVILDAKGRVRASGLHPGLPDQVRREIELAGKPLPGEP
ncbi:MAG: TlpA disulfide reductase family protein [Planctomycetota bacterium]|nr:TlpA disulfide reductase family protein [Planctomycetota bacterium]